MQIWVSLVSLSDSWQTLRSPSYVSRCAFPRHQIELQCNCTSLTWQGPMKYIHRCSTVWPFTIHPYSCSLKNWYKYSMKPFFWSEDLYWWTMLNYGVAAVCEEISRWSCSNGCFLFKEPQVQMVAEGFAVLERTCKRLPRWIIDFGLSTSIHNAKTGTLLP